MIIQKVYKNKMSGQKLVTVPVGERDIQDGDYVQITKIKEVKNNGKNKIKNS